MKALLFVTSSVVFGFLIMYWIASRLDVMWQYIAACLAISVLATIYKNLGPRS